MILSQTLSSETTHQPQWAELITPEMIRELGQAVVLLREAGHLAIADRLCQLAQALAQSIGVAPEITSESGGQCSTELWIG